MSNKFKFCPKCGKAIIDDDLFCRYCGASLENESSNVNEMNFVNEYSDEYIYNPTNAFTYMFKDKSFYKKALILYAVIFVFSLLSYNWQQAVILKKTPDEMASLLAFIGFFVSFITSGYLFSCIKNVTKPSNNYFLPKLKLQDNFVLGAKAYLAGLLLFIPLLILLGLTILLPVCLVLVIISLIIFLWFVPAFMWIFANKEYITIYFKIDLVKKLLDNNKATYAKGFWCFIAFNMIFGTCHKIISSIAASCSPDAQIIVFAILNSAISTYFLYFNAYILAKMFNPKSIELLG